jgi:hypothetical protein
MSKKNTVASLLDICRDKTVEGLVEKFDKIAAGSKATRLEVLVAAIALALEAVEVISDQRQQAAIKAALIKTNLQ